MIPVGYVRISQDRDESVSIGAQIAILQAWAKSRGLDDIDIYRDEGISAYQEGADRPGFAAMLKEVRAGRYDTIVCKSIDRLSRRIRVIGEVADIARVITAEGDLDSGTPSGRMVVGILGSAAEFESGNAGQRQRVSQDRRRELGRALGAPAFGYTHVQRPDGAYKVVNPEEARIVQDVFEWVENGDSLRSISDRLNRSGVLTQRGNLWSAATVGQMVSNRVYLGMRLHHGEALTDERGVPIIDQHLQIISPAQFERVQARRAKRRVTPTHGASNERLLLQGIAICAGCGRFLTRQRSTVRGRVYWSYSCPSDNSTLCEARAYISATKLDNYILGLLEPLGAMPIYETVLGQDEEALAQRGLIQSEIARLAEQMASAGGEQIADLAQRIAVLREEFEKVEIPATVERVETGETFADLLTSDPRRVIAEAIEQVEVAPAGRGRTRAPVEERVTVRWADSEDFDSE